MSLMNTFISQIYYLAVLIGEAAETKFITFFQASLPILLLLNNRLQQSRQGPLRLQQWRLLLPVITLLDTLSHKGSTSSMHRATGASTAMARGGLRLAIQIWLGNCIFSLGVIGSRLVNMDGSSNQLSLTISNDHSTYSLWSLPTWPLPTTPFSVSTLHFLITLYTVFDNLVFPYFKHVLTMYSCYSSSFICIHNIYLFPFILIPYSIHSCFPYFAS